MNRKLSSTSIPTGLSILDRPTLSIFLAVFEDSAAIILLSDNIMTFADGAVNKYLAWRTGETLETQERFSLRIQETALKIEDSAASDDCLRICLWTHLRYSLGLLPRIAISPRDMKNASNDIGTEVGIAVSRKRALEERASQAKSDIAYWKDIADKLNPFSDNSLVPLPFSEAVRDVIFSLFKAVLQNG